MAGPVKRLVLKRRRGFYGMARALEIEVDGEQMGTIRQNGVLDIAVPADAHSLVGRMDWGQTDAFPLSGLTDGTVIEITGAFALSQARMLGIAPLPFRFTVIEPVGSER